MSDSSRVQISFLKQSEKGTVQSNEAFKAVRHTGGSFGMPQDTVRSESIRGDAQRSAAVRVGANPEATLNMEITAKVFDDLLSGFVRGEWSAPVAVSETVISADNAESRFVSGDTTALDWTGEGITVGQWVYVAGFDESGANGWFKVTSITDANLGVTPAPAADANTTDPNAITVGGSYVRNGASDFYFALQCQYKDLTSKYRLISDARIGQMDLSIDSRSIVNGSFQFTGVQHDLKTEASGNGEVTDAENTEILNSSDHATGVYIDGEKYDGCVLGFTLSGDMAPRRRNCVGQLFSESVGLGSLNLSGSLSVYLSDEAWTSLLQNYMDFDKIGLAFPFVDSEGNGYVFEVVRAALTTEPGNIPGPDGDVQLDFEFEAEPGTLGSDEKTLQISRSQVTA